LVSSEFFCLDFEVHRADKAADVFVKELPFLELKKGIDGNRLYFEIAWSVTPSRVTTKILLEVKPWFSIAGLSTGL
jgi:hypothetical protein